MTDRTIRLTLKIWRQKGPQNKGRVEIYHADHISTDMSFLEMLDVVNEQLTKDDKEPIAFDHDCREGICGMCGAVVNGRAHGPEKGTTLCQLHMRHFSDGDTIVIEPWRSRAFPIIKDLVVDRTSFWEQYMRVKPWLIPPENVPEKEFRMSAEEVAAIWHSPCRITATQRGRGRGTSIEGGPCARKTPPRRPARGARDIRAWW